MDITATVVYDSREYVARGVSMPGMTCAEWAERFVALGGAACTVSPSWQSGCPAGRVAVNVAGTAAALGFVMASCGGAL